MTLLTFTHVLEIKFQNIESQLCWFENECISIPKKMSWKRRTSVMYSEKI